MALSGMSDKGLRSKDKDQITKKSEVFYRFRCAQADCGGNT